MEEEETLCLPEVPEEDEEEEEEEEDEECEETFEEDWEDECVDGDRDADGDEDFEVAANLGEVERLEQKEWGRMLGGEK